MGKKGCCWQDMYVIAWVGVKFGINFTSCSENGSKLHEASQVRFVILTMSEIYPKITHAITFCYFYSF